MPTVIWRGEEIEWKPTHIVSGKRTMKVLLMEGRNLPAFIDEEGNPVHGGRGRRAQIYNPSIPWKPPLQKGENNREVTPAQLALALSAYVKGMAFSPNGEVAVRDGVHSKIVKLAINQPTGGQIHYRVVIPETFSIGIVPIEDALGKAA